MTGRPERLEQRPRPVLQRVETSPSAPRARTSRVPRVSRLPHVVLAAVVLGLLLGAAIEPAPSDPSAGVAAIEALLGLGLVTAIAVAALFLSRPRVSLAGSAAVGITMVVATVGCPLVGHHEVAAWWYSQLGIGVAATIGALVARHRLTGV